VISRLLIFVERLRGLFARQKEERELNDEIRMHLRLLTDQFGCSAIRVRAGATRQRHRSTHGTAPRVKSSQFVSGYREAIR
jgi:hypothetical protein